MKCIDVLATNYVAYRYDFFLQLIFHICQQVAVVVDIHYKEWVFLVQQKPLLWEFALSQLKLATLQDSNVKEGPAGKKSIKERKSGPAGKRDEGSYGGPSL